MQLISGYLFCILLLYQIHLLVLVGGFLVEHLRFSIYSITLPAKNDTFTSSFTTWMPFVSSCPTAVARTPSTMLNNNGESKHPCLIPTFQGNTCSFAH